MVSLRGWAAWIGAAGGANLGDAPPRESWSAEIPGWQPSGKRKLSADLPLGNRHERRETAGCENGGMSYDLAALAPHDAMRAAVLTGFGGPEVLEYREDVPAPILCNSEALVRVFSAGVNPIDAKTRSGKGVSAAITQLPWILGGEFAGVVVQPPYEFAPFQAGDEVVGMLFNPRFQGAYAEYVTAPILSLAKKPENLSMEVAGAVPLAALTAWNAIVEAGSVRHGMRILIHAGAGGVGHFAIQFAKVFGARVVTTASARNREFCEELGADQVIDYTATRFEDALEEPVDLVVDLIGNVQDATGSRSIQCLADGGTFLSVPTGSFPTMHEEIAAAGRELHASHLKCSPDGRALQAIMRLIEQGDVVPHLERSFPLKDAAEAHRHIESGRTRGKITLTIS